MARSSTSFRDRTVLVTGASSGIGRETALAFAAAGANLVLVARRAKVLGKRRRARRASSARKRWSPPTDVTKPDVGAACFRKAVKRFGQVDVVVNNAGVLIPAKVVRPRDADLQRMLDVNLFGALHVMQEAVKVMREQGRGHIVNVGSLAGRRGFSPLGGYCATKFALVGLTEALRTGARRRAHPRLAGAARRRRHADGDRRTARPGHADMSWPERAHHAAVLGGAGRIFLAIRFRLAEIAVPPGTALIEKLAALAPGTTDALLRRVTDVARSMSDWRRARDAARTASRIRNRREPDDLREPDHRARRRRRRPVARPPGEAERAAPRAVARRSRLRSQQLDADPEVRAIVLAGRGKAFCAGIDLMDHAPAPRRRRLAVRPRRIVGRQAPRAATTTSAATSTP